MGQKYIHFGLRLSSKRPYFGQDLVFGDVIEHSCYVCVYVRGSCLGNRDWRQLHEKNSLETWTKNEMPIFFFFLANLFFAHRTPNFASCATRMAAADPQTNEEGQKIGLCAPHQRQGSCWASLTELVDEIAQDDLQIDIHFRHFNSYHRNYPNLD